MSVIGTLVRLLCACCVVSAWVQLLGEIDRFRNNRSYSMRSYLTVGVEVWLMYQ